MRSINSDDRIRRNVADVAQVLEEEKLKPQKAIKQNEAIKQLVAVIDGAHLKSKERSSRSFEAMIATVFSQDNLRKIDKNHNEIIQKTSVASALSDNQKTIKRCSGLVKERTMFYRLEHHDAVKLGGKIGKQHRKSFIEKQFKYIFLRRLHRRLRS